MGRAITVEQTSQGEPLTFTVTVQEHGGETHHRVTMSHAVYNTLTGGTVSADRCIQATFQFLLDREPKESILARFDVTVISQYFPSFERDLGTYL